MIEQAKKLNPDVEFHVGDMRTIRLGYKFSAVLIHDAISYMLTEGDLRADFGAAAAHLGPGGVFVTTPDWLKETLRDPFVTHATNSDSNVTLTTLEYTYDPDPADTTVECLMWYVIREGADLRVERDRHTLGLSPVGLGSGRELVIMADEAFGGQLIIQHASARRAYGVNLLPNGSFEETAHGKPVGWRAVSISKGARAKIASEPGGRTGKWCVKVTCTKATDSDLGAIVAWPGVAPSEVDRKFRMSCWVDPHFSPGVAARTCRLQQIKAARRAVGSSLCELQTRKFARFAQRVGRRRARQHVESGAQAKALRWRQLFELPRCALAADNR